MISVVDFLFMVCGMEAGKKMVSNEPYDREIAGSNGFSDGGYDETTRVQNLTRWAEYAGFYDVCALTPWELVRLADSLFEAELIAYDEHALLTFDPSMANPSWSRPDVPSFRRLLTEPDTEGRYNWISEFQAALVSDDMRSEQRGLTKRVLRVLQRLASSRGEHINSCPVT